MKASLTLIAALLLLAGCSSEEPCIDKKLAKRHTGSCFAVYNPVCGCNGKSYANECEAGKAGVTSYTKGVCK